ncbi:Glycosyltransferase like family 2 [Cognatiyoonia koreensis]|uniref:Glycosyltransferase like family 2 n=1 Tax=Cognatiyoonia koreensis TaxID=364200 RepID=A0A1I0RT39_9RHOB|nr:glycosyltransferase family 2 protein [Cognatiyoonia koreensis]SEW44410.1 Glycosyltransferase like family 2 [Cognatiyoonia koreensis]
MKLTSPSGEWIAVVVVNYGTAELTITATNSVLERARDGREVRVIVVDNASPHDDAATLTAAHQNWNWQDRVSLCLETENHGFGRGNNVALRALQNLETPPSKVLLLNPDASLHNNAIDMLANTLDAHPSAAAAGAAVLREDLTPTTSAFRFPCWRSELARILSFGPIDRMLSNHLVAMPKDTPGGLVDWVSGAAVMFDFSAMSDVNFFDPIFFLYYEEVDLMRRLGTAGRSIIFVPEAQVLHAEGTATGQFASAQDRQRDPWYLYESWAHYFERAYGRPKAAMIALSLWPMAVLHIVHRRCRGKQPTLPKSFFRDHFTHVLRPLFLGPHAYRQT